MSGKIRYSVLIAGIGLREVEASATNIDDAYLRAVKEFNCDLDAIMMVSPMMTIGETMRIKDKSEHNKGAWNGHCGV